MRDFIIKCDGCGKDITPEVKDKATTFVQIEMRFKAFMLDPNTGQEEEMTNLDRQNKAVYCNDCFNTLINHIDNFNREVSPEPKSFIPEHNITAFELQSGDIDGPEAMEKK